MKYLRIFTSDAEYQAFIGGGVDYVEPHVVLIDKPENEEDIVKFKEYIEPEVSPLEGGVTLNELYSINEGYLEDTSEMGKVVYQYLYKKCGNGTAGSTYYLTEDEELYFKRKVKTSTSASSSSYREYIYQLYVAIYQEWTINNKTNKAIYLYETNPNSRADVGNIVIMLNADGNISLK